LARLSVLAALGKQSRLREELQSAVADGVPLRQIHEAFLQLYLFVGFPRMINAFMALEGLDGARPHVENTPPLKRLIQRGERLCRSIYGKHYEPMISRMRRMHPELAKWILSEGYGKVLSRPHLPARVRELCVIGILSAQGLEKQLYFHVRGALRLGARPSEVRSALSACRDLISKSRREKCLSFL
jgi:4-carboxymuconolactone decarboxylase